MAWLLFNNAAVSIVEHKDDPTCMIVRARVQGDIERFLGKLAQGVKVRRTPEKDYLYRAFLPREVVAEAAAHRLLHINYPNFKNSVKDHERHSVYSSIWSIWLRLQRGVGLYGAGWAGYRSNRNRTTGQQPGNRRADPYGNHAGSHVGADGYQRDLPWWRQGDEPGEGGEQ